MIRVGQVTGAYGLEGAVKVMPLTDFDDRFDPGALLVLDGAAHEVEWSRESQPGLVVKLQGIENRTVAELFRGFGQRIISVVLASDLKARASLKAVLAGRNHRCPRVSLRQLRRALRRGR